MKKISLVVAAIAACTMGLASCTATGGGGNTPTPTPVEADEVVSVTITGVPEGNKIAVGGTATLGADVVVKGNATKTVTWETSAAGIATVNNGVVTAIAAGQVTITARSTFDVAKSGSVTLVIGDIAVDPEVKSVTITTQGGTVQKGTSTTVSATVDAIGGASKAVNWSSSNPDLASINSYGVVNFKNEGDVTITATSAFDATKFDTVDFTIKAPNWSDEILDEMTEKLGEPIPYLGSDFDNIEWDDDYEEFYAESTAFDSANAISIYEDAGYEATYGLESFEFWGYVFEYNAFKATKVVGSKRISVSVTDYTDDEDDPYAILEAYAVDLETEWPTELVDEYTPKYMDYDKVTVPAVNAEYYVISETDGLVIEVINAEVTAETYIANLKAANWYAYEDEEYVEYYEGVICVAQNETAIVLVSGTGNNFALQIGSNLPALDAFPQEYVNAFVKNTVGSIFTVPGITFQDTYYYAEGEFSDGTEVACVNIAYDESTTETEIDTMVNDYKTVLEGLGYEVEYEERTPETDESYGAGPSLIAQKGKICLEFSESTYYYEYDLYIYANPDADEESPFEIDEYLHFLLVEESSKINVTVDPEFAGKGALSFNSLDPDIATVDNNGNITPVALGNAEIEVIYTVSAEEVYKDKVLVYIVEPATGIEVIAGDEVKMNETLELAAAFIPAFSKYSGEGEISYAIASGSEYASIEGNVLIPNADAITEDVVVTVTASIGSFVSEPYAITIKYAVEGATIDFSKVSDISGTVGSYSYKAEQKTGSNPPIHHDSGEIRLYPNNVLTISSTVEMTTIEFVANTCTDSKNGGSLSCSTGTITETATGFLWTGNATEVKFTGVRVGTSGDKGKQTHIQSIIINGGSTPTPGPSPSDVTPLDVIKGIADNLFGDETQYEYDSDYDAYYTAAAFGDTSEYTLLEAVEEAVYYLPDSIVYEIDEPYEDTWSDGSDGAFATYCDENSTIIVEIGSYEDDGDVIVQFCVYEYSEE